MSATGTAAVRPERREQLIGKEVSVRRIQHDVGVERQQPRLF
jgi:hypothetical protein